MKISDPEQLARWEYLNNAVKTLEHDYKNKSDDIESITSDIQVLKARQEKITQEAHKIYKESSTYGHGRYVTGKLVDLRKELAVLERLIQDDELRVVVFIDSPAWRKDVTYIVDKLTKKRIYIREKGIAKSTFYDRTDGTSAYSGTIDIAATFPEGVDNFTGVQS